MDVTIITTTHPVDAAVLFGLFFFFAYAVDVEIPTAADYSVVLVDLVDAVMTIMAAAVSSYYLLSSVAVVMVLTSANLTFRIGFQRKPIYMFTEKSHIHPIKLILFYN